MNKNFKISVITVTKNSEKFLEENINSLKIQSYKNLCKKIYNYYRNRKLLKKKSILAKKYLYRFDYHENLNKYVLLIMKYIKN